MFEISASDGRQPPIVHAVPRERLAQLIASALWQGTLASCAIENIKTEDVEMPAGIVIPNSLLKTT